MSFLDYIKRRRANGEAVHLSISGKLHESSCEYDVEVFRSWLKMSVLEGTDRIKVIAHPTEGNKWVVTILDKRR